MKTEDKYKDGVTLMADAIRREQAEEEKKRQQTVTGNVSDATAQFSGKSVPAPDKTPAPQQNTSESTPAQTSAPQQGEGNAEPDGTMYTE